MKKESEPLRLYIEYLTSDTGGVREDSKDPYSQRSDRNIEVEFIKLYKQKPEHLFFCDSIEIQNEKMDTLYLAVIKYTTGDSFGKTTGMYEIIGVAPTAKIALVMLEEAVKPSNKGYKPWEGYFERIESKEVYELSVE